ncbi:ECF transporter S component [Bacillus timonensis]|uniref:ECF transporter S component n=1 Tax=Bacillus timonensis TaxID=1033734 RepID=UPI0002890BA5|nr:ECF transporter S component [Bacillus timonensis]
MKKIPLRQFVAIAMLSTISYILMFFNFPLPTFPSFLNVDFSDVPALLAALIFGPMAGILVELFKNMIDYFITGSETGVPVGHISNFVAGIIFVLTTYYIFKLLKTKTGLTLGLIGGTIMMAVIMSVLNYYVFLPAFNFFLNIPAMSAPETLKMVVYAILPFNFLKGLIVAVIFMLLYVRIHPWINKQASI